MSTIHSLSSLHMQASPIVLEGASSKTPSNSLHHHVPNHNDNLKRSPRSCCSLWRRLKACCRRKHPMEDTLSGIMCIKNFNPNWDETQRNIVQALNVPKASRAHRLLQNIFHRLNCIQLETVALSVVQRSIEDNNSQIVQNFLQFVSMETIQTLLDGQLQDLETTIAGLAEHASKDDSQMQVISPKQSCYLVRIIRGLMETILKALSYFEAGREPGSTWEASQILSIYGKIFAFPLLILGVLGTLLVNPLIALLVTVGIIVALGAALLIYVKYLRGRPERLEAGHNLSADAAHGSLPPAWGRYDIINQIIQGLAPDSTGTRRHVLLVGNPGVGKNTIIAGLAARILRGDIPEYLKNNEIQEINTVNLHDSNFSQDNLTKLEKLLSQIEGYKDEFVVFFDEIQSAIRENSDLADRLQKGLDGLPKVIAATTQEGYTALKKNRSLLRRFKIIHIEPTKRQETVLILREIVRREAIDVDVSEKSLKQIFKLTKEHLPNKAQPDISKQVLLDAISHARAQQCEAPSAQELSKINEKYEGLCSRYRRDFHKSNGNKIAEKLKALAETRNALQAKHAHERDQLAALRRGQQLVSSQQRQLVLTAAKIMKETGPAALAKLKKDFFFSLHIILPHLEKNIKELKAQFPEVVINETLIKKIVDGEVAADAKL